MIWVVKIGSRGLINLKYPRLSLRCKIAKEVSDFNGGLRLHVKELANGSWQIFTRHT